MNIQADEKVVVFMGKRVDDMTRDELIGAISWCEKNIDNAARDFVHASALAAEAMNRFSTPWYKKGRQE